jgi:hypothetical protein
MEARWTLSEESKLAWKRAIDALLHEADTHPKGLVDKMGLGDSHIPDFSRFKNGKEDVLKRWLETRADKYGRPLAKALEIEFGALLTLLDRVRTSPEAVQVTEGDWHPAFPGIRPDQMRIAPPTFSYAFESIKKWQSENKKPVRVRGRAGSGRSTFIQFLSEEGIEAVEEEGRPRWHRTAEQVQMLPWRPNDVLELGRKLVATGTIQGKGLERLEKFLADLEREPALGSFVEQPGEVIHFLREVVDRGVPEASALRATLLGREYAAWDAGPHGPWVRLVTEAVIDDLLVQGFLAGAHDEDAWGRVVEAAMPRRADLRAVQAHLNALDDLRGAALKQGIEALRQHLRSWSAGDVVDRLVGLGCLLPADGALELAPSPLMAARLARKLIQVSPPGWYRPVVDEPMTALVIQELAVLGLSWSVLRSELVALPSAFNPQVAHHAMVFAAHTPRPGDIQLDDRWLSWWSTALWVAVAGLRDESRMGPLWDLDGRLRSLKQGGWPDGEVLAQVSLRLAGRLPRLEAPDWIESVRLRVPEPLQRAADVWWGVPFPPPRQPFQRQEDEPLSEALAAAEARQLTPINQALAWLAPGQCIPRSEYDIDLGSDQETRESARRRLRAAWTRAAEAGDSAAIRLLARGIWNQPEVEVLRWIGRGEPDEDDFRRAHALLFAHEPAPFEQQVEVLGRFSEAWVSEWLVGPRWDREEKVDALRLAEALRCRSVLEHLADVEARFSEHRCWYHFGRHLPKEGLFTHLHPIDHRQSALTALMDRALAARQALYRLGHVEPLRTWGLDGVPTPCGQRLVDFDRPIRGTWRLFEASNWETLSALLPDAERALQLLEVAKAGDFMVLRDSPFKDLVAALFTTGRVAPLCALARLMRDRHPYKGQALSIELFHLRALADLPDEADGPRALLAVILLLWRYLNAHDRDPLLQWLGSLAGEQGAPPGPDHRIQSAALEWLVEAHDEATLRRYCKEAAAPHHWDELVRLVEQRLPKDTALRDRLMALDPPPELVKKLVPPIPDPLDDLLFAEAMANNPPWVGSFARQRKDDPRGRQLIQRLISEAHQRADLDAELYWRLMARESVDALLPAWMAREDLFEGCPEFTETGTTIRAGWGVLVKRLEEQGDVPGLQALLDRAPMTLIEDTYPKLNFDWLTHGRREERPRQLELPFSLDFGYRASPKTHIAAVLARLVPDQMLALGRPHLIELGLDALWVNHAPLDALLAALDAGGPPCLVVEGLPPLPGLPQPSMESSLAHRLITAQHEPFFTWIEGRLRATPPDPDARMHLPYRDCWGLLLDLLIEHRRPRAIVLLDELEAAGQISIGLLRSMSVWSDDPQLGRRVRRWSRALLAM